MPYSKYIPTSSRLHLLGVNPLDIANDSFMVSVRNVKRTSSNGGDNNIHYARDKEWIVSAFGRSEKHFQRISFHAIQEIARHLGRTTSFKGNYTFNLVCPGENNAKTIDDAIDMHQYERDNKR